MLESCKMFPKCSKKSFNNLVTGDETWVYYFEPKRKCSKRVWATKDAIRPSIAKRQRAVKFTIWVQLCNYPFQSAEPSQEHFINMLF